MTTAASMLPRAVRRAAARAPDGVPSSPVVVGGGRRRWSVSVSAGSLSPLRHLTCPPGGRGRRRLPRRGAVAAGGWGKRHIYATAAPASSSRGSNLLNVSLANNSRIGGGSDGRTGDDDDEAAEACCYGAHLVTTVAESMRRDVRAYTASLRARGIEPPLLVGILANNNPDAIEFSDATAQVCEEDGINYQLRRVDVDHDPSYSASLPPEERRNWGPGLHRVQLVERAIRDANNDPSVTGVLVYYPVVSSRDQGTETVVGVSLPRGPYKDRLRGVYYKTQDDRLRDLVDPHRDVEGLCHAYHGGRLVHRDPRYVVDASSDHTRRSTTDHHLVCAPESYVFPCTALSVVRVLQQACSGADGVGDGCYDRNLPLGRRFENATVTVINRSDVVGRPLAAMLANDGAEVYSADADSVLLFRHGVVTRVTSRGLGEKEGGSGFEATLENCVRRSNVVVTGVPDASFRLPIEWIRRRCGSTTVVVNVAHVRNVDEYAIHRVRGVRYVPSVGKVTVAALERNLIDLHMRGRSISDMASI